MLLCDPRRFFLLLLNVFVAGNGTPAREMARSFGRQQKLPDSHGRPRHDSHTVIAQVITQGGLVFFEWGGLRDGGGLERDLVVCLAETDVLVELIGFYTHIAVVLVLVLVVH